MHLSSVWHPKTVSMDKKWKKEQSISHCVRLYLLKMEHGQRSYQKECVALVNDDLMVDQWGITITLLQVQRAMKYPCMRSLTRTTCSAEMTTLPNYMYLQKMKTNIHSLQQGRDASIKNRAHLPMADLGLISYEVSVLPSFRYAYAMTDLSTTPHGSETISNKHQAEIILFRSNIPSLTVQHGGPSGEINLANCLGLGVIYSHSRSMNRVSNATEGEMVLLAHALDPHSAGIVDTTRNGHKSFTKRIVWGIGQNQCYGSACNCQFQYSTRHVVEGFNFCIANRLNMPT